MFFLLEWVVSSVFRSIRFPLIVKIFFFFFFLKIPRLIVHSIFEEYKNLCKKFMFLINIVTYEKKEDIHEKDP